MRFRRRRSVVIRTDDRGVLVGVWVEGKVEVVVVEDQPVKRTWLDPGQTVFNGGPDDDRPIVLKKPGTLLEDIFAATQFIGEADRKYRVPS